MVLIKIFYSYNLPSHSDGFKKIYGGCDFIYMDQECERSGEVAYI